MQVEGGGETQMRRRGNGRSGTGADRQDKKGQEQGRLMRLRQDRSGGRAGTYVSREKGRENR